MASQSSGPPPHINGPVLRQEVPQLRPGSEGKWQGGGFEYYGRKWGKSWLYYLTNGRLPCATEPQDHATPYTRGGSMRAGAQEGKGPLPLPPPEHDLVSARLTAVVFDFERQ